MSEFVFGTHNAAFVQVMYEQYLRDPASVGEDWRQLFDNGKLAELPVIPTDRSEVLGRGEKGEVPSVAAPSTSPHSPLPGLTPITGPAARLVQNMTDSLSVPTATSFREIAVDILDAWRRELNAQLKAAGKKISYTHLIGYAIARAARELPVMTHAFRDVDGKPHRFDPQAVNLGLAVDVEKKDGSHALVVPVIRHAEGMDFATFHSTYETLVDKARTNKLVPDDFAGATITLTNPGTIGTVASVPRLMKGQGSIIATGAIRTIDSAKVMTITSTYDHRIIQGAESGIFLRRLDGLLQGEETFYGEVFESLGLRGRGEKGEVLSVAPSRPSPISPLPGAVAGGEELKHVAAAMALVKAIRNFGHLAARLDPLGSEPPGDPALEPERLIPKLTPELQARIPARLLRTYVDAETLAEALPKLQQTYGGTIAYEVEHISDHEERVWLREAIESGRYRAPLTDDEKRRLLARLTEVEGLETYLRRAFLGQKQFSIEGVDVLVPMLDEAITLAAEAGAHEIVTGMAHRGRLNVLAHIIGRPYEVIMREFEGERTIDAVGSDPEGGSGDVKYHLGAAGARTTPYGEIAVTLASNPSHLEAVNPVVEGQARAEQTDRASREGYHDPAVALPILIHGDAAFPGQGIVAETLNLSYLDGYSTGGTLHIITNNQVGFTTDPEEGRSTRYASDLAKGYDAPIIHVNADDPEAAISAVRLALAFRRRFCNDVVIDLVGYRRHGHNEQDEPAYTQPLMAKKIAGQPTVRAQFVERLAGEGVVTQEEADSLAGEMQTRLRAAHEQLKRSFAAPPRKEGGIPRENGLQVDTAVARETLVELNAQLLQVPEGFTVHPKLLTQLQRRLQSIEQGGIDWGQAEALAFASLLVEGIPVRLTGQDTERGTFSQRHLVLHDAQNGMRHAPIQHLPDATASMEVFNSPLSEYACVGFEYGYSVAAPDALVLWEAQFGDFVNGAQIILDQFISSGLSKWGQTSRLTLLLPHGYEGNGPEHSSARLERFLQLAAQENIRIANCTTAAQYFHLLRRQALTPAGRPLVVMTPKGLLRLKDASSTLDDLALGSFAPLLDDPNADHDAVTRLVLCSGKVYYDIAGHEARAHAQTTAVARLEQLYPFPVQPAADLIRSYPNLRELVWTQEEPQNMGPWRAIRHRLEEAKPDGVVLSYAGRPWRASPSEGYPTAHQREQERIVRKALAVAG